MKNILDKIWKFLNSRLFAYIGIVILVIVFIGKCNRISELNNFIDSKNKNIEVLNDTIKTVRLKNGDLRSSIGSFQAKNKELKLLNENLYNEVAKRKDQVVTLNRIVFQLKQDTADLQKYIKELIAKYEKPKRINDSTWDVDWTLPFIYDSTNYDIFSGRTRVGITGPQSYFKEIDLIHNKTTLLNRESQIGLTWGQEYEGKGNDRRLKVYAETAHPAFKTKLLEGTYVDYPEKRHWFTGFGIGPQLGVGYDFINNEPSLTIGVGVQYNIYQW